MNDLFVFFILFEIIIVGRNKIGCLFISELISNPFFLCVNLFFSIFCKRFLRLSLESGSNFLIKGDLQFNFVLIQFSVLLPFEYDLF